MLGSRVLPKAVGQVGLHVADNAMPLIHDQAAQVVESAGFAGFD